VWSGLLADIPHQQSSYFSFFLAIPSLSATLAHLLLHLLILPPGDQSARCSWPAPTPCHVRNAGAGALLSMEVTAGPWGTTSWVTNLRLLKSMKPTGWAGPQCPRASLRAEGQTRWWACELLAVSTDALQEVTLRLPQLHKELYQWQRGHGRLPFPLGAPGVNGLHLGSYGSKLIIPLFSQRCPFSSGFSPSLADALSPSSMMGVTTRAVCNFRPIPHCPHP